MNKTELREIQKHCNVIDQIAERRKIVLFFEASRYFIGQTPDSCIKKSGHFLIPAVVKTKIIPEANFYKIPAKAHVSVYQMVNKVLQCRWSCSEILTKWFCFMNLYPLNNLTSVIQSAFRDLLAVAN